MALPIKYLAKLLSISSESLAAPCSADDAAAFAGVPAELRELWLGRNGFVAFENALVVRPLRSESSGCLGCVEWNQMELWKSRYGAIADDLFCFAEDAFGNQFAYSNGFCRFVSFCCETAEIDVLATTLEEFCAKLLGEWDVLTGHSLVREWQIIHGPIRPGHRLCPRVPFVGGGAFSRDNYVDLPDVELMHWNAAIYHRISPYEDGQKVDLSDLIPPWSQ